MTYECESPEGMRRMERLGFRIGRLVAGIAILAAGIGFAIGFALLVWYNGVYSGMTVPAAFNPFAESRDCAATIQLLAGPFASSQDEKQNFYWGYDLLMEPYIILFTGELGEECQALLDYTYSMEADEVPEPVTLRGRSVAIENTDIYDYALEFYTSMWGTGPADRNDFKQVLGTCYLDTTELTSLQRLPWHGRVLVFLIPAALCFKGIQEVRKFVLQKKRERARLARLSEWELGQAVRQLGSTSEFEPGSAVYVTADFVITGNCQFDIVPFGRIVSLEETGSYLIAVTADGSAHILLSAGRRRPSDLPWALRLKGILEEKIRYIQTEGGRDAVISGY